MATPWRLVLAFALLVLGATAFAADLPVARAVAEGNDAAAAFRLPGDLRRFFDLCEVFAHGLGVAMISIAVLVLDWKNRGKLPRILACAYFGGLLAVSFKLWIERIRPGSFFETTGAANAESVWQTFRSVAWLWHSGNASLDGLRGSAVQSFPSGHAATAVGLAAALSWRYSHAVGLFVAFAALACVQRITSHAHWTSDVLIGAGCGLLFAECCLGNWGLGHQFTRLEKWLAATE